MRARQGFADKTFGLIAAASFAALLGGCTSTGDSDSTPLPDKEVDEITMPATPDLESEVPVAPADLKGECHGVNQCKGQGSCGGPGTSCAGTNSCKGKGWLSLTKAECDKLKGKWQEG